MAHRNKILCGGMLASILLLGGCSQKEAESPFQSFLQGDFSMLCQSEAYDAEALERITHDLSTGNFTFEEMEVSGDGEKELLVKSPNDPTVVKGVFHKSEAGIQCWLWDTDERCVWTLEENGILRKHDSQKNNDVWDQRISFDADGQQGIVVDVGGDVPRFAIFSSFSPSEKQDELIDWMRTLTIYRMDDRQVPIQTLTAGVWHGFTDREIFLEDLNFDGYLDISYVYAGGNVNCYDRVFLWDTTQGAFCENEALEQLSLMKVDAENKVISEWIHGAAGASGADNYYRYIDGKLTCIRSIEYDYIGGEDRQSFLSVKDYQDGELKTVFYETVPFGSLSETTNGGVIWPWLDDQRREEWNKWNDDLNYHGKYCSGYYTITFDSCGGSPVETQFVSAGSTAVQPTDPTRSGCGFDGWYLDTAFSKVYDFEAPVTSDVTLYASWVVGLNTTDSDGDGLIDVLEEGYVGTDAHSADTDGDGMNDREEWLLGADPLKPNEAPDDSDGDGIRGLDEVRIYNTYPDLADSDKDGLSDYAEIFEYHTNPRKADTDWDGLDDKFEIEHGLDPNVA